MHRDDRLRRDEADGGDDPAGDQDGRRKPDDATPEAVGKPAAEDLPCDIGERLEAEGRGGDLGPDARRDRGREERLEDALVEDADRDRPREQDPEPVAS